MTPAAPGPEPCSDPRPPGLAGGPLVFISAAEPSADLHAASLIRAVHDRRPEVRFAGVAGPAMQNQGCWPIFDMTRHSAMLLGALRAVPPALKLLATAARHLKRYPFQAAVLVDSPMLNLPIARRAKRQGVPVLYYVAPQLWAWGEHRLRRIRARVDRMAVILPFEETYFRDRGIDATYVGHPLFDTLADQPPDPSGVGAIHDRGRPVLAVLPGSRKHVVEEVLRGQLEIVSRLRKQLPDLHAGISVANDRVAAVVDRMVARSGVLAVTYRRRNADLLTAADLALVASGTATLEVAYHHTPMIVMYNANRWAYRLIGRWFIRTRHLSLVNIIAGRDLVPEFMPYYTSIAPIAGRAAELLSNPDARRQMSAALADLLDPLVKTGASHNTAEMLLDMIGAES